MRIIIDLQGAQTESRFRGIGRYTISLTQSIVRNKGEHEVIIALNGLFPDTIEPIRASFEGLLSQENILVWHAPGPVREEQSGNDSRRETAELIREAFMASLQPDVILVSSLFEGYVDDAVTSIGRFDTSTPVIVIFYDLIPLLYQDHYFKFNLRYKQYYLRKVEHLRRAAKCLAISDFSCEEGLEVLGKAGDRIVSISTAVDPHFQPKTIDEAAAYRLRQKFGITRPFVFYTGGSDQRKNLPRLIEAYAALPTSLRARHQLVFAGKMPADDVVQFQVIARSCGLKTHELLFVGYVTDEELVQLYNLCQLFVFPSWHEGFGLPVLEAMSCGAPIVCAGTSSLPEVMGFEEALFDPFDVAAITEKMAKALEDNAFRATLCSHGLQRAKKFSWDESAKRMFSALGTLPRPQSCEKESWGQISQRLNVVYQRLVLGIAAISSKAPAAADEDLQGIAVCLEHNERQLRRIMRPMVLPQQITWRIEGPFDSSYSLALVNRETARALAAFGHEVVLHSTEGPGDFPANKRFLDENPDLAKMNQRAPAVTQAESDVTSRNLYPPRVADMNSRLNLLHGYAWEESGFPSKWVDSFNHVLHGVLVTSRHVKKVLIDNGVTVPIAICENGVDHWDRILPDTGAKIKARTFRFLHVSSCFPRKGADVMLEAYGRSFSQHDDVTLVIKTFQNPHNEIHRWLEEARSRKPEYPDVLILEGDYSDAQLKGLYGQCHALVAPSRAEGFGLPMAEAMLSGLAVVTTGWSGQLDFCTPKTSWLVDYRFERAQTHFNLFSSVWADPDIEHLAERMREVYEASDSDRESRVWAGRKLLLEKFRWSLVAERMIHAARQWSRVTERPEPRIGWITTWNTRCGIATYSEHLIKNMPTQLTVFAAQSRELTAQDRDNVYRCWVAGDSDRLNDLRQSIELAGINTLVLQFNYGFFNFNVLADFLKNQIEAGRVVVAMMHATTDPAHAPHKKLAQLIPALSRCHRLLVHSPNDMNRLKAYGLVENVTLFPHGIVDFVPSMTRETREVETFVIGSYGFFLPHKGLLELIEAVALLRNQGELVELQMFNAEYPVPDSKILIEEAMNKIDSLNLGDLVSVCTDYFEDEVCLSKLAGVDLIVFPYQETGESSSAAVRYGLATGRPVAVTPLSIFEDVSSVVFQLPGQSPQDIADGIREIRHKLKSDNFSTCDVIGLADQWRERHRYSAVGRRLYNMLYAIRNDTPEFKC